MRHRGSACTDAGAESATDTAYDAESSDWTYDPVRVVGRGAFGTVYVAVVRETGQQVAIKSVPYAPEKTSRELAVLQKIQKSTNSKNGGGGHPALLHLLSHGIFTDSYRGCRFQFLVTNYVPLNLTDVTAIRHPHSRDESSRQRYEAWLNGSGEDALQQSAHPDEGKETGVVGAGAGKAPLQALPSYRAGAAPATALDVQNARRMYVKVILFQLARGLAWLHKLSIVHRDLKPDNVLFDPVTLTLQVCDLGSAKEIVDSANESNAPYICTRYYRAPELLLGACFYGCEVDLWSFGCIAAELFRDTGLALFRGSTSIDQMCEIYKILGTPSLLDVKEMCPRSAAALLQLYQATDTDPLSSGSTRRSAPAGLANGQSSHDSQVQADEAAVGEFDLAVVERYNVTSITPMAWPALFPEGTPGQDIALVDGLLRFSPSARLTAAQAVQHLCFDELFNLDWPALHFLQEQALIALLPPGRDGPHKLDPNSPLSGKSDEQWRRDNALLDALFHLVDGEETIYGAEFSARMSSKYYELKRTMVTTEP